MPKAALELTPDGIREYREKCGWSRAMMGKYLGGVPEITIKAWERGINMPPPYLRYALLYINAHIRTKTSKVVKRRYEEKLAKAEAKPTKPADPFEF